MPPPLPPWPSPTEVVFRVIWLLRALTCPADQMPAPLPPIPVDVPLPPVTLFLVTMAWLRFSVSAGGRPRVPPPAPAVAPPVCVWAGRAGGVPRRRARG